MMSNSRSSTSLRNKMPPPKGRQEIVSDKAASIQSSLMTAKFLRLKLENVKAEKELDEKMKAHAKLFSKLIEENDQLADELSAKRISNQKFKLYLETIENSDTQHEFLDKILKELEKIDESLDYLIERAKSKQSIVNLIGVKEDTVHLLNDILQIGAEMNDPKASKLACLARESAKIHEFSDQLAELRKKVDQQREECQKLHEEKNYLRKVREALGQNGS